MPFAAIWMKLEIIILSEVRQISCDITYMWNIEYDTNELIYKQKQTHRHRKQTYGYQRGKRRDKLGVWVQQIQTTIYKIGKQQGPTVQHRELSLISCNKLQ